MSREHKRKLRSRLVFPSENEIQQVFECVFICAFLYVWVKKRLCMCVCVSVLERERGGISALFLAMPKIQPEYELLKREKLATTKN